MCLYLDTSQSTDGMALMPRLMPVTIHIFLTLDVNTTHTLTDCRHSQFSKFPVSSLSLFCVTTNRSDFRQIAKASPNFPWILHLALYLATPLCVLSVTRYRVHSADCGPR